MSLVAESTLEILFLFFWKKFGESTFSPQGDTVLGAGVPFHHQC